MLQLARWLTLIEQFDYEVAHRPGNKHGSADGLSRKPFRGDDEGNPSLMEDRETCPIHMQTIIEEEEDDELSQKEVSLIPTIRAIKKKWKCGYHFGRGVTAPSAARRPRAWRCCVDAFGKWNTTEQGGTTD